jgi:hypothetical protein
LNTLVIEKAIPGGQILVTDWIENTPASRTASLLRPHGRFRRQAEKFGRRSHGRSPFHPSDPDNPGLARRLRSGSIGRDRSS